jgi:hypothetical protein
MHTQDKVTRCIAEADIFKHYRLYAHLTQQKLAAQMELPISKIQSVENGKSYYIIDEGYKFVDIIGICFAALFLPVDAARKMFKIKKAEALKQYRIIYPYRRFYSLQHYDNNHKRQDKTYTTIAVFYIVKSPSMPRTPLNFEAKNDRQAISQIWNLIYKGK